MQADIYTAFLTNKVKVFATQKGAKPLKIAGRYIRKAYPFLLCSAMVLSSCSQPKSTSNSDEKFPQQEQLSPELDNSILYTQDLATQIEKISQSPDDLDMDWKQIYENVIQKHHIDTLKEQVPFSKQEILDLMANPNPPQLKDINYNHCIENQQNFWEIVRNGLAVINEVQNSDNLTENQKKEYKITAFKMLSQITKYKGTKDEVDLQAPRNKKAALFFEKSIRHKDDYTEVLGLGNLPGFNDERCEFLGRYYEDFEHLAKEIKNHPNVENFVDALYCNNDRFILTPQDSAQANIIGKKMVDDWFKEQNITDENIYQLTNNSDVLRNAMKYGYLRGTTFLVSIKVEEHGQLNDGKIAPVWVLVRHEMQHLGQFNPCSNEKPEDNHLSDEEAKKLEKDEYTSSYIGEIGPTLSQLAWEDQIYKKLHNIDSNTIVDYGVDIDTGAHKIPLGKIATWFWQMEQKYPHKSIDKVIAEPEVLTQLNKWGDENADVDTNYSFMIIQAQQAQK